MWVLQLAAGLVGSLGLQVSKHAFCVARVILREGSRIYVELLH